MNQLKFPIVKLTSDEIFEDIFSNLEITKCHSYKDILQKIHVNNLSIVILDDTQVTNLLLKEREAEQVEFLVLKNNLSEASLFDEKKNKRKNVTEIEELEGVVQFKNIILKLQKRLFKKYEEHYLEGNVFYKKDIDFQLKNKQIKISQKEKLSEVLLKSLSELDKFLPEVGFKLLKTIEEIDKHKVLPIYVKEKIACFVEKMEEDIDLSKDIHLYYVLSIYFYRLSFLDIESYREEEGTNFLNELDNAVFIQKNDGQIVFENNLARDMLVDSKKISAIKDNELFLVDDIYFNCMVKTIFFQEKEYRFIMLSRIESGISQDFSQELGIVTSSIAHELNNPFAGMLAAIECLFLEDNLNIENKEILVEMKKSIKRCQNLVSTFLGFSRKNIKSQNVPVKEVFDNAMKLLRFKMIESNILIEVKNERNSDVFLVNNSIMTMVFYIILSEIITSFSHYKLLTFSDRNIRHLITISIVSDDNFFKLNWGEPINYLSEFSHNEFVMNLLKMDGLEASYVDSGLVIGK